ncbi:Mu transposase C-terminal domain-containing protein [Hoeflea alexandrii]|uniref:Mu transposase C-terminal domain-containing protein n=1 Tax=Hoeflea alexandrii TaxID=288436 RepID=UPI0035D0EA1E
MSRENYYTALEIAELAERLKVGQMPWTKDGVIKFAKREGWDQSALCRDRLGRGGGKEYHFSLFPEFLINAMIAADQKAQLQADAARAMAVQQTALAELAGTGLSARQRVVMEARAGVVQAVKAHEIEHGCTTAQAVLATVERAKSDRVFAKLAQAANDKSGDGKSRTLSRAAVYRWIKDHKEQGVAALAPKASRDTHSFPHWFGVFMSYYARPQAPTITAALDDLRYKARLNDLPSYDQVRRCLAKLDKHHGTQARHRGREGAQALKARHAYVVRDTSGLMPTSVYTADGKLFDAEVQHPIHGRPFRPEITAVLDVYTRKCVGWSVGLAENAKDVRDALRVACMENGIPAVFYVDRGPGFKNDALDNQLTGFCARLGITKMHSLPYNSQARGIIERFNGSALNPLAKEFASYIGADMDREARQKAFKTSRKELKEIGATALLPTWQEFMAALAEWIIDYNRSEHDGLTYRDRSGRKHKITPEELWQKAQESGFEAVTVLPHEADDLFRPMVRRRTRRGMVEFLTNSYFDMALEPYDGLDVLVGYDVHDASRVWVREIDQAGDEELPGRLIAVAAFEANKERYIPLSFEQAATEKRAAARLRRLDAHRDEVEAEANPHRFLTQSANPTISPSLSIVSPPPVTIDAVAEADTTPASQRRPATATPSEPTVSSNGNRPPLGDDHLFAAWCSANHEAMTEKDRAHLQSMLRSKRAREFLRVHDHDLDALEKLTRQQVA